MAKKKKNNPLEGLQRFDVAPNHVPEINKILGMRHRAAGAAHDKRLVEHELSGDDGRNSWLKERWDRRADYLEKGLVTPYQWGSPSAGRRGPIDGDGNIINYNVDEKGNRRTPVDPDQWPDDYYSYGLSADRDAPEFERYGQEDARSGKIPRWVGNSIHPDNRSPLHKWGGRIDLSNKEMQQKIKGAYERSSSSVSKTATQSKATNKTGKVEESALPQTSEKPVAKKKKNEPEYVPSKSEKDFSAGRMPGITGTEAEAAAALAKTRKASTSKVTGKAKEKLQAEIEAHPDFRGTRQLTDEEVAANEGGASAPKSKGKGKKKPSAPAVGSSAAVEEELATGRSAQREAALPPRPAEEPKKTAVEQYMADINDPEKTAQKQADIDAATSAPAETKKKRNFPNVNNNPTAAETSAETAVPDKNKPGYYREKFGALLDSLTPEEEAQSQAAMDAVTAKEEAALDADEAERKTGYSANNPAPASSTPKGDGRKYILNTDKSGTSEPVYGNAAEAKANAERIRQIRTAREGGTMRTSESAPRPADGNFYDWGSETTPASPSSPSKPGLGQRMRTFLGGGKGGRSGGAPTPATNTPMTPPSVSSGGKPSSMPAPSAPSASAPSAPSSRSGSFYNISGPVTFGDQTNLGRGDFGGGNGGGINVNNSANINFAPQVIGESTFGNITGGSVNTNPTVASTAGRATSTNRGATVLSTGGPASSGQPSHPRAQNAQRGGRPTTNNAAPAAASPAPASAPEPKNPRKKKP